MSRRVVVTGVGLLTPLGIGTETSWEAIRSGKSGIGPITQFDAAAFSCRIAGEVWEVPETMMAQLDRFEEVPVLYTRQEIEVELEGPDPAQPGRLLMAHAYFMPAALDAAGRELHEGCWPA